MEESSKEESEMVQQEEEKVIILNPLCTRSDHIINTGKTPSQAQEDYKAKEDCSSQEAGSPPRKPAGSPPKGPPSRGKDIVFAYIYIIGRGMIGALIEEAQPSLRHPTVMVDLQRARLIYMFGGINIYHLHVLRS